MFRFDRVRKAAGVVDAPSLFPGGFALNYSTKAKPLFGRRRK
jgi:hypothetical protein